MSLSSAKRAALVIALATAWCSCSGAHLGSHPWRCVVFQRFWDREIPRLTCSEARAVKTGSKPFVLAQDCNLQGIQLEAGTGVTTWQNADELRVYPHAPLRIGRYTCCARREASFVKGRLRGCDLASRTTVDGIDIGADSIYLAQEGHLLAGRLDGDQVIRGIWWADGTWTEFHRAGVVSNGTSARNQEYQGIMIPAGVHVSLGESEEVIRVGSTWLR